MAQKSEVPLQLESKIPEEILPRLRRYAEDLTGSRDVADRRLTELIEEWYAEPRAAPAEGSEEFRLFALLHRICFEKEAHRRDRNAVADHYRQQAIALMQREGFTSYQAARLCNSTPVRIERERRLAERARKRAVFVIEDEFLLAREIGSYVETLGLTVCGSAASENEAVTQARGRHLDLIVADVSLRNGGSGVVAANRIRGSRNIPIIYLTAHAQWVEPLNVSANDRVLEKPFDPSRFRSAVERVFAER